MLSARPSSPPRDPLHCPRPATRAIIIFTSVNIITTITFIYYYHYFNFILWWCAPMRPSSPPSPGCPAPAAAAPAAPWLARETAPFPRRPRTRAVSRHPVGRDPAPAVTPCVSLGRETEREGNAEEKPRKRLHAVLRGVSCCSRSEARVNASSRVSLAMLLLL